MTLIAALLIDEIYTRGSPLPVESNLMRHRIRQNVELPTGQRRRQMHSDRLVVGTNRAAAPARRSPQTRSTMLHGISHELLCVRVSGMEFPWHLPPVERLCQHRAMASD